jgi:hypothetical protein
MRKALGGASRIAESAVINDRFQRRKEQNNEQQKTIPTDNWFNIGSLVGWVRRNAGQAKPYT